MCLLFFSGSLMSCLGFIAKTRASLFVYRVCSVAGRLAVELAFWPHPEKPEKAWWDWLQDPQRYSLALVFILFSEMLCRKAQACRIFGTSDHFSFKTTKVWLKKANDIKQSHGFRQLYHSHPFLPASYFKCCLVFFWVVYFVVKKKVFRGSIPQICGSQRLTEPFSG